MKQKITNKYIFYQVCASILLCWLLSDAAYSSRLAYFSTTGVLNAELALPAAPPKQRQMSPNFRELNPLYKPGLQIDPNTVQVEQIRCPISNADALQILQTKFTGNINGWIDLLARGSIDYLSRITTARQLIAEDAKKYRTPKALETLAFCQSVVLSNTTLIINQIQTILQEANHSGQSLDQYCAQHQYSFVKNAAVVELLLNTSLDNFADNPGLKLQYISSLLALLAMSEQTQSLISTHYDSLEHKKITRLLIELLDLIVVTQNTLDKNELEQLLITIITLYGRGNYGNRNFLSYLLFSQELIVLVEQKISSIDMVTAEAVLANTAQHQTSTLKAPASTQTTTVLGVFNLFSASKLQILLKVLDKKIQQDNSCLEHNAEQLSQAYFQLTQLLSTKIFSLQLQPELKELQGILEGYFIIWRGIMTRPLAILQQERAEFSAELTKVTTDFTTFRSEQLAAAQAQQELINSLTKTKQELQIKLTAQEFQAQTTSQELQRKLTMATTQAQTAAKQAQAQQASLTKEYNEQREALANIITQLRQELDTQKESYQASQKTNQLNQQKISDLAKELANKSKQLAAVMQEQEWFKNTNRGLETAAEQLTLKNQQFKTMTEQLTSENEQLKAALARYAATSKLPETASGGMLHRLAQKLEGVMGKSAAPAVTTLEPNTAVDNHDQQVNQDLAPNQQQALLELLREHIVAMQKLLEQRGIDQQLIYTAASVEQFKSLQPNSLERLAVLIQRTTALLSDIAKSSDAGYNHDQSE